MKKLLLILSLFPLSLFSQKLILRNLTDTATLKICVHIDNSDYWEWVTIGPRQRAEMPVSVFYTYTVMCATWQTWRDFFTADYSNMTIDFTEPEKPKA